MNHYSPFERSLKDLVPEDLGALRQAAEGWYVEYKSEVPNAASIGKSISAFANTYGGWLFYGVEEKSKEDAVAGAFPGVLRVDVDASLQRIRQAVAAQLNPSPHFECTVLWGPCDAIGLNADKAIICIQVPWSPSAPHVHKSGQVYRRVGDGSEPRPENDRFILDQLFRRADDLRERYREWVGQDPEFSEGEGERPFLRLMLVADLWRDRDAWADVDVEGVREIMGHSTGTVGALPFDTVHTTSDGFVARQLKDNDPSDLGLTWRFRPTLVSDVLIPLTSYAPFDTDMLPRELEGYDHIDRFAQLVDTQGHTRPSVVDLNYLFNALIGVVEIQRRLMDRAGWEHDYFVKARLLNVWGTIPFLDIPSILDSFDRNGIPMCLDGEVTTPKGSDPRTFAEVRRHDDVEHEQARVLLQALSIFAPVARAYGFAGWMERDPEGAGTHFHEDLQTAGGRAMEVQRLRLERARGR